MPGCCREVVWGVYRQVGIWDFTHRWLSPSVFHGYLGRIYTILWLSRRGEIWRGVQAFVREWPFAERGELYDPRSDSTWLVIPPTRTSERIQVLPPLVGSLVSFLKFWPVELTAVIEFDPKRWCPSWSVDKCFLDAVEGLKTVNTVLYRVTGHVSVFLPLLYRFLTLTKPYFTLAASYRKFVVSSLISAVSNHISRRMVASV